MEKMTMYAATGNLGYGFPEEALRIALQHRPAFLGCDAGSCDPGPSCLGTGKAFVSRGAAKRDLRLLVKAGLSENIPVLIGSAGGSGSDQGVDGVIQILREILQEEGLHAKVARIYSEQTHEYLKQKLSEGKIIPLAGADGQMEGISGDMIWEVYGHEIVFNADTVTWPDGSSCLGREWFTGSRGECDGA